MDQLDIRQMRAVQKQRNIRDVFKGSVALSGVSLGLFFLWLAFTFQYDSGGTMDALLGTFLQVLSFVFGISIAVAAVSFAFLKD